MKKEILEEIILTISKETNIKPTILEKDYYVCLVLKELSIKQEDLKAYFKGGTAVYKIINTTNRFSEDIDLTVEVIETDSKNSNANRLKKSALKYQIEGLELIEEKTLDRKGSITAFYKYSSIYGIRDLYKSGMIQVESTSFTISKPTKRYLIEPLIYKYANEEQKKILKDNYYISDFAIDIISLERIFIDKLFATEFYYIREDYQNVAKHLYDITILFNESSIKSLLKNKKELSNLISLKRLEEKARIGGIDEKSNIKDFKYLNEKFNNNLIKTFNEMQNTYVLKEEYIIDINQVTETLEIIKQFLI